MLQDAINTDSLNQFQRYLAERKPLMREHYHQLLAQDLSRQLWEGCFQRTVLAVLTQTYQAALIHLENLPFNSSQLPVNQGKSDLTRRLLASFDGFVDEFLSFAVDKHRTSCALSNFPDEHKPSDDYVHAVKREVAELWRHFAIDANRYFLDCQ